MRLKKLIKVLFFLVYSHLIFGQNTGTDIIKTNDYIYFLDPPKNWVSNQKIQGVYSAFYPEKSTWHNSSAVMYVNIIPTDDVNFDNIFSIIDYDLDNYYINAPNMRVDYGDRIEFENGNYLSMVVYLRGAADGATAGHSLAIAYIPQHREVMNIVMSAQSQEEFEKNLPAFEALVKSYHVVQEKNAISKN